MSPEITKFLFFGLIVLATAFEVSADIFFKKWSIESRNSLVIIGMVLYAIGTFVWAYSLKYELLSKAISYFTVINLVVVVLIGVLFFGEKLSGLNIVGIVFGVASIILLSF